MLAAVLLRQVHAAHAVHLARGAAARRKGPVRLVEDDAILHVNVQNGRVAEPAAVGGLPAALREEGGAVEHDAIALTVGDAGEDGSLEREHRHVLFVQLFRLHGKSPLSERYRKKKSARRKRPPGYSSGGRSRRGALGCFRAPFPGLR